MNCGATSQLRAASLPTAVSLTVCLVTCRHGSATGRTSSGVGAQREAGVGLTQIEDIRRISADGVLLDSESEWSVPKETPIHTALLGRRPAVGAVVHAHPPAALLAGLADLVPRPVFGAFNIPAMRMAMEGVPVYPRPVLISRPELAQEMMDAMGDRPVCVLRGHGITAVGPSVEAATVAAVNLNELLTVTVALRRIGADPPGISPADAAELPNLGQAFNDGLAWRALVAELALSRRGLPEGVGSGSP